MADETTPETVSNEGEIPFEQIKNVFALRGKNVGCSVKLRGKVVMVAFLINDGESQWDPESQAAFVGTLRQSAAFLMDTSGLGRHDLNIAYAYCQVTVPYVVERRNSSRFVKDVLRQFGYEDAQSYQRHYESKFLRDEACISFVFNKKFRSYASRVDAAQAVEGECPDGNEYSVVSFNAKDPADSQRTFIHELLHQFGAIDFYYPERLMIEAEHYLPGSIMNSGNSIDGLTRYIIGWDDAPSAEARAFLKAISKISPEEVAYAARDQWLT